MGVLVAAALVVAAGTAGVRFAPHSREQADLAARDKLWEQIPRDLRERSRFTSLADAAWVPWQGATHSPTGVGRYYETARERNAAIAEWAGAASVSGWLLVSSSCDGGSPVRRYSKTLGRWPATLTTSFDVTGTSLLAIIQLPLDIGGATSAPPADC